MIPNEIINDNNNLKKCNNFRSLLYSNNFYTQDILNEFVETIKSTNKMDSYISSYYIYYNDTEPEIRLTLRKAYFNRFGYNKFNPMVFYQIFNESMKKLFMNHSDHIITIIGKENFDKIINSDNISLIYNIYRVYDNIIIIEP